MLAVLILQSDRSCCFVIERGIEMELLLLSHLVHQ